METPTSLPPIVSCGFLIVRGDPLAEFLLLRHADRWDLPKGHVDPGESELECALRELQEETGITAADIDVLSPFRFEHRYEVFDKYRRERCDKRLVVFLGRLTRDVPLVLTEHLGSQWFPWQPPHAIQARTIDPLLAEVERFGRSRW